jgi:hypothetical protein
VIVAQRMRRADPGALAQVLCGRCDQAFLSDQPTYQQRSGTWVHEVCPAGTEFAFGGAGDVARTWTRMRLPARGPERPHLDPELQVARMMVEAWTQERVTVVADFDDVAARAWLIVEKRLQGRELSRERDGRAAQVREMAEGSDPADRLLGWWRTPRRGAQQWVPGIAGMEPREAEAIRLAMEGWQPWEIQRHVKPKRDGEMPALESVYAWLSEGRRRLRELFQMPAKEA